jgi:rod shape-determining protein MreC
VKQSSGRDFFALLALCVIGALLGRMQSTARAAGRIDPLTTAIRATVNPAASVLVQGSNSTSDFFSGLFNASELKAQNRALKQLEIVARQYAETVDRLNREIASMRAIDELPVLPGRDKVMATVIGYFPEENRITISLSKTEGIKPGQAVVTGEGLVGTIQTVVRNEAQVSLLSDPNRKLGALVISRNPPSPGIIKGENASILVLTLDASLPVENGDLVSTWGFSGLIPRGVPIGRVSQIYTDRTTGSKRVEVFPNVSMGNVREVVVLK